VRQTGLATLVVDKNAAAVTSAADRVVILVKGQIAFAGNPSELKANPELMHRHLGV
jgi:branched-chain amino acid transport system ATP-binding protein